MVDSIGIVLGMETWAVAGGEDILVMVPRYCVWSDEAESIATLIRIHTNYILFTYAQFSYWPPRTSNGISAIQKS